MKLKLSYSVIRLWQEGKVSEAIEALHGHWQEPNQYMKYGIEKHKEWENETKVTGRIPEVFGGKEIENFYTEQYHKKQILDWLWLSGIIDLQYEDNGKVVLVDYKTGKGTANQYTNGLQAPLYKILVPEATMFRYLCYNQYENKVTSSFMHLSKATLDKALETLISVACDIRATLEQMGLEDFDNVNKSSRKATEQ